MSAERGFVMLPSYFQAISPLEDQDRLALYDAIMRYVFDDQEPVELQGVLKSLFTLLRPNIDSSIRQYRANVENGKRGGRPRKHSIRKTVPENSVHNPEKTQEKPKNNPIETNHKPTRKPDKEKDKEKDKDKELKIFCTEPQSASVPPVVELPLNDGSHFDIFQGQVDEWQTLYPAVDVPQALRSMRGWLLANPKKRKTKAGVLRFVTAWLSREQDKGGTLSGQQKRPEPLSGAGKNPEEDDPWGVTGTQL